MDGIEPAWAPAELRRPVTLLAVLAVVGAVGSVSVLTSCGAHELGHAAVGTALGWEVDEILLCPFGGYVRYTIETGGTLSQATEAFAGGLLGALFLGGAYWAVLARRRRPLRGPLWWAAGIPMVAVTAAQLFNGVAEGVLSGLQGRDYNAVLAAHPAITLPIAIGAMLTAIGIHVWRWRAVFTG